MEQEKKTGKLESWCERNKGPIIGALACTLGGLIGMKYGEIRSASGFKALHESGIVKFFDPATNLEVTVKDACEVAKRMFKK